MRMNLTVPLVACGLLVLAVPSTGCRKAAVAPPAPARVLPVYEAEIEIAPGRKAKFRIKDVELHSLDMQGDFDRTGAEVISNIAAGKTRDTIEIYVPPGTREGTATLTATEMLASAGAVGRTVASIKISVKGKGLPTASMTSIEPLSLDTKAVVFQGGEVVLDVYNGKAKSATPGKDGLTVKVEDGDGKSRRGAVRFVASKDAKIGEQKIVVLADEKRYPSDEAELGTKSHGAVEVTVTVKSKE